MNAFEAARKFSMAPTLTVEEYEELNLACTVGWTPVDRMDGEVFAEREFIEPFRAWLEHGHYGPDNKDDFVLKIRCYDGQQVVIAADVFHEMAASFLKDAKEFGRPEAEAASS